MPGSVLPLTTDRLDGGTPRGLFRPANATLAGFADRSEPDEPCDVEIVGLPPLGGRIDGDQERNETGASG